MVADLGPGKQQVNLPELVQDEDVRHHRHHPHDLRRFLVFLQLRVTTFLQTKAGHELGCEGWSSPGKPGSVIEF